jgi:putative phosphoribosyl transferase
MTTGMNVSRSRAGDAPERAVRVDLDGVVLEGTLAIPAHPAGVVLFAHGSGSSRHSPRNRFVARHLQEGGFATLLIDLLTGEEEQIDAVTRHLRFDIPFLGKRLTAALDWLTTNEAMRALPVGLFGASTGAAAALVTAAERSDTVGAVVSRGGRPDLAGAALPRVVAPALLIVGERDEVVIELNRQAQSLLRAENRLDIVRGATHLFEEPGTLERVASLARAWFAEYLRPPRQPAHLPSDHAEDAHTAG